jgi:hypothetical protein
MFMFDSTGRPVDSRWFAIDRAVKEYDERLFVGVHEGQLTVFIKMAYPDDPYPVFGLGLVDSEPPHPEDVIKRLALADTRRRGSEILDRMNKENAQRRARADQALLDERQDIYERLEYAMRSLGWSPGFVSTRARPRG